MNILVSDAIEQRCVDILSDEGFSVDCKPGLPHEELAKIIGNYDALVVRSATQVDADLIATRHI